MIGIYSYGKNEFATKAELQAFLHENQSKLIAQKCAEMKRADAFSFMPEALELKDFSTKEENQNLNNPNILKVKVVINTTNLLDSHCDVHIPSLWKKSLSENKMIMHLQEHEMEFDKIISDSTDLKAYTQLMQWKQLGYDIEGVTEALIFESTIKNERNPFMLNQYKKGYVKNHSVGMRYMKIVMCQDNKEYGAEYEAWEKYYPQIANKEAADMKGYFWAVTEAKVIEGSAVPIGSNWITPTLTIESKNEPSEDTQKKIEPSTDTQKKQQLFINYLK